MSNSRRPQQEDILQTEAAPPVSRNPTPRTVPQQAPRKQRRKQRTDRAPNPPTPLKTREEIARIALQLAEMTGIKVSSINGGKVNKGKK